MTATADGVETAGSGDMRSPRLAALMTAGTLLAAAPLPGAAEDMPVRVTSPASLLAQACADDAQDPLSIIPTGSVITVIEDNNPAWLLIEVRTGSVVRQGYVRKSQTTWQPSEAGNGS